MSARGVDSPLRAPPVRSVPGAGGKPRTRHTRRDPSVPPRAPRTAPASDGRGGWAKDQEPEAHPPGSGDGAVIAQGGRV